MNKIFSTFFLLSILTATIWAAPKEIKITKVTGQVRVISGDKVSPAIAGQTLPADSTLKTYSGAQVVLTIAGSTKIVDENRMLSASTLSGGDNALEGAFNLIGKLSAKNYTGSTSVAVAGVRGAEQGKKGSFGVQWQGTSQTKTSASATSASELEQARNLCSAQDFEGAISKLSAFISSSSDAQSKARANLLLSQANLELARSDKAIAAANAGLELSPNDSSVITQLNFALLSATWYTGKADATLAAIENYFPKTAGNASDEYWNAQVIKVLALKSTGNKMAAKKLKEELSSTCPNDEVVATLSQISF